MKIYPTLKGLSLASVRDVIEFITRERVNDKRDWDNLPSKYILGRKVARVPSASSDVIAGDRVGDFNVDLTYAYYLVDNAGTAVWRRVAVGSW